MRVYLNGIEYKTYRSIMKNLGVKFGCINYEYIYTRTPRFDFQKECSFFEDIIAIPGRLPKYAMNEYKDFLNNNAGYFSFAISSYPLDDCEVKILYCGEGKEYYITYDMITKPFALPKYKQDAENGAIIHGLNFEKPFLSSYNTGTWMRGRGGLISYLDKNNKIRIYKQSFVRTAFARELIEKGYDLNLDKIKRNDWKEVAKYNCAAWKQYQEFIEDKENK